jgi:hypothetical protein
MKTPLKYLSIEGVVLPPANGLTHHNVPEFEAWLYIQPDGISHQGMPSSRRSDIYFNPDETSLSVRTPLA